MNTMGKRSIALGAAASLAFIAALSAVTSTSVSALESRNRLWGQNRYDTAADICKDAWTTSDYAVIVRGDEFADALCAAPLAQKFNAPILLTEKDSLNAKAKDELKRLNVKHIIIVGGVGAISEKVEKGLNTIAPVERIYGSDRYDTSINIAAKLGTSSTVVLATGEDYADAISIAPIAAMKNMPIILVSKDGLTEAQKNYLSNSNIKKTYIVGGKSVINDEILKQVHGGIRLGGSNRYGTNARIIDEFKDELNFDNIYAVIGEGSKKDGFADALSGAPLAAKNSAPIILTNKSVPSEIGQEIKSINGQLSPKTVITAIGGESVVPDKVIDEIKKDTTVTYEDYKSSGSPASITNNVRISTKDAEFKNTNVAGNVYVYGDNAKLTNITVKGILFIDPGEGGSTYLENVKADEIKLRSGGSSSIHIKNVTTNSFEVESSDSDRSVRIVADGSNTINSTIIRSNAVLDSAAGSIGNVEIEDSSLNNKIVEFSGKFDSAIIVKSAASLKIDSGAQVSKIEVPEDAPRAGVTLTGTGEVKDIQVKNNTAKINIPSGYKVTGKIEAVDKICIDTSDSSLASKVEVKDPGSMTGSQGGIPIGPIPSPDYAPAFTSMSLKSASGKAANASITSDTLYLNIPESIGDNDKFIDGSIQVSEVLSKVTFNQSLSYEPAGGVTSENLTSFIKSHEAGGDGISKATLKQYDGAIITITDLNGNSASYTLRVLTTNIDMINNGQNVTDDVDILTSGSYGSPTGVSNIKGNVTLGSDGISLSNVKINGKLTVNPGDNGVVYLKNVTADDIEVLSGAWNSVHMDGVKAGTLNVSNDDTVRIVASNGTNIVSTNMNSGGKLEVSDGDSASSTFGSIEIASDKDVELKGNLGSSGINVSGAANVSVNDNSNVGNIIVNGKGAALNLGSGVAAASVKVKGEASAVNLGQNSVVTSVDVSASGAQLNLGDGANISTVTSSAPGTNVSVSGTNASVGNMNVSSGATDAVVSVGENARVQALNVGQSGTTLQGNGVVEKLNKDEGVTIKVDGCEIKDGTATVTSNLGLIFALSNPDVKAINLSSGAYTITQSDINNAFTINGSGVVTIKTLSKAFFTVRKGASLTLSGVVLNGGNAAVCGIYKEDKNSAVTEDDSCFKNISNKVLSYDDIVNTINNIKVDGNFDFDTVVNALKQISVIPDKSVRDDLITKLNTGLKDKYITFINKAVAAVTKADQITKISDACKAKQEVSDVYKLIDDAKVYVNAKDSDFNLTDLKATESKLKLYDAAVKALSMVPQVNSVNISNLASSKALAVAADTAIKNSGITDFDTANLNSALSKIKAIEDANTALSSIPSIDSITKVNYKDIKVKTAAADNAVNNALACGALKTDLLGLDRLDAAKYKISQIEKAESDKAQAIKKANDAIALIPASITIENIGDAQAKVQAAEDAVKAAQDKGAALSDFIGYTKIKDANSKIEGLLKSKDNIVSLLKQAVAAIPNPNDINVYNVDDADAKVQTAVKALTKLEPYESDPQLTDLITDANVKINAASAKINEIRDALARKAKAIEDANSAIKSLPEAQSITMDIIRDNSKLTVLNNNIQSASQKVSDARALGAVDADFVGLDKLNSVIERVKTLQNLEKERLMAVSDAIAALISVPDANTITVNNVMDAQFKVQNAENLVNIARSKGTSDSEFKDINHPAVDLLKKLKDSELAVKNVLKQIQDKSTAISIANAALKDVYALGDITRSNIEDAKAKVLTAENAVALAISKGAVASDFTSYSADCDYRTKLNLTEASIKTVSDMIDVINTANAALFNIPDIDNITESNYITVQQLINSAENAVKTAKDKGAVDSDFVGLDRLSAAKNKVQTIASAIRARQDAVAAANKALSAVPDENDINKDNIKDAESKISAAEDAVKAARDLGAVDSDFIGLKNLDKAKIKAEQVEYEINQESGLNDLITKANAAIAAVPDKDDINIDNLNEARIKIKAADDAIAEAKAKGAKDSDFVGLDKLEASRTKIIKIDKAAEALAQIPEASDITFDNEDSVTALVSNAESLIKDAEDTVGAKPTDFAGMYRLQAAKNKLAQIDLLKADRDALNVSYNGTDEYIVLPDKGSNGTVISWSAQPEDIINIDKRTVVRPKDEDKQVTLTATIIKNIYKDGNVIDSVSCTKSFTITVKQLNNKVLVSTFGKKVTITVVTGELNEGNVTIKLLNKKNDNLVYAYEGKFADGTAEFETELDSGDYYGYVTTTRGQFSINEFTVDISSAGVSTADEFNLAYKDNDITNINLMNPIELSGDFDRNISIKAQKDMPYMLRVSDGLNLSMKNVIIDGNGKNLSYASIIADGNLKLDGVTIANVSSGVFVSGSSKADIENSRIVCRGDVTGFGIKEYSEDGQNTASAELIARNNDMSVLANGNVYTSAICAECGKATVISNKISGFYDGIAISDGAVVNDESDVLKAALNAKAQNPEDAGNIRANVAVFRNGLLIFKDIASAQVNVTTDKDAFTIDVTADSWVTGDATLKIIDDKGNVKDFGQQPMIDGKCEFKGTLPGGVYTAVVKVPGIDNSINTNKFAINIPDAVTASVDVNNGTVTITVNCPNEKDGTSVTIQLLDKINGDKEAYIGQGTVISGKCTFTTNLDAGTYYGYVKVQNEDAVSIAEFAVSKAITPEITMDIQGNSVTAAISCPDLADGTDVMIEIKNVTGDRLVYTGQGEIKDGKITFSTELNSGSYYGTVNVTGIGILDIAPFDITQKRPASAKISVSGNKVTLEVESPESQDGTDVTFTLTNSDGTKVEAIGQGVINDGVYACVTELDAGQYIGTVNVNGFDLINIPVFTVEP